MADDHVRHVDPEMWKACAGTTVNIPAVDSRVYYFPKGHIDHCSDSQSVPPFISHLSPTPFHICRVLEVLYLVDHDSDEVFTRIRLEPLSNGKILASSSSFREREVVGEEESTIVSFAKILTPSDANNGGGFSVPRFCADSIFPPLDFEVDPPVQTLSTVDLHGNSWEFRHIYRGTPRRHLLTTGWSKFVNSKRLITGDSVVFMKNKVTKAISLGVRRAKKSISAAEIARWAANYSAMVMGVENPEVSVALPKKKKDKVPPESVAEALQLAADGMPFEVTYYPKAGSHEFLVSDRRVEAAMAVPWMPDFKVKMMVENEDSSRLTSIEGTVAFAFPTDGSTWEASPWKMLQITWNQEPGAARKMETVNPWLLESTSPSQLPLPLPSKKPKLAQNGGLSNPPNYNTIHPAMNVSDIQGSRQNTRPNIDGRGSSHSPDSSITLKTPSPENKTPVSRAAAPNINTTTSIQLFGQTLFP